MENKTTNVYIYGGYALLPEISLKSVTEKGPCSTCLVQSTCLKEIELFKFGLNAKYKTYFTNVRAKICDKAMRYFTRTKNWQFSYFAADIEEL